VAVIDLAEKLSLFSEHWSPKVVARLNDYEIKLVKLKGEFVWHVHEDTDELFLVVEGSLTIQLRDQCSEKSANFSVRSTTATDRAYRASTA